MTATIQSTDERVVKFITFFSLSLSLCRLITDLLVSALIIVSMQIDSDQLDLPASKCCISVLN